VTVGGYKRRARVKANTRGSHYQGVVTKPRIESCVLNLEYAVPQDCMPAKGDFPRCLFNTDTDGGFKPLPSSIDQTDQRDGPLESPRGDARVPIETTFAWCIENTQAVQRRDSARLVFRQSSPLHYSLPFSPQAFQKTNRQSVKSLAVSVRGLIRKICILCTIYIYAGSGKKLVRKRHELRSSVQYHCPLKLFAFAYMPFDLENVAKISFRHYRF